MMPKDMGDMLLLVLEQMERLAREMRGFVRGLEERVAALEQRRKGGCGRKYLDRPMLKISRRASVTDDE